MGWSRYNWLALAICLVGTWRIAGTHRVFTATYDEPYQIASGMQLLDLGKYRYEWQHPPLGRVAVALGLRLADKHAHQLKSPIDEGNAILADGEYWSNLELARWGTLPFYWLACGVVFVWARRLYGEVAACGALGCFAFTPPVMGHAGYATLDAAAMAGIALALYAASRWVEEPGRGRAVWLGVALGVALATKFSAVPYLAACFGLGAMVVGRKVWHRSLWIVPLVAAVVVWGSYGFTLESLGRGEPVPAGEGAELARMLVETKFPLSQVVGGLFEVLKHNSDGHDSYLLGQYGNAGWWYFFLVALVVKTPVAMLVLVVSGVGLTVAGWRGMSVAQRLPLVFVAGMLLVCVTTRINLGLRHALPLYPVLAVVAGATLVSRWRAVAAGLVVVSMVEGARAYPDHAAYFNVLAGKDPSWVLAESDLDWGQDLERLRKRLRELNVERVNLAYFGTADVSRAGLPEYVKVGPGDEPRGWCAVSVRYLRIGYGKDGGYRWFVERQPVERVGQSIWLYRID